MKRINLSVPLGYRMIQRVEQMPLRQAEAYLLSRRFKRYTKAVRMGNEARLYASYLVCPHCGKQFVANSRAAMFADAQWVPGYRIPKVVIRDWASMQLSLFEDEMNRPLWITSKIKPPAVFFCPDCARSSRASTAERKVELQLARKKIVVKCEVAQIDEILSLEWIRAKELHICFPLFEAVIFDLAKGRVSVKVEDRNGTVLGQRDITADPELLRGGAVCKLLEHNKKVMRNVKRLFREAWKEELPYTGKQIDLFALFKMTMFVGYPLSFYACVPFARGTYAVDRSFRRQARRLHSAKNIEKAYQQTGLPQAKSVRRLLFQNPGLFFYDRELYGIWTALKDINLLCRFLRGERVYEILSALHMRPGMLTYISDYCSVKGAASALDGFERSWSHMRERAIDYSCMSTGMRRQMQERWKGKKTSCDEETDQPAYSLPMHRPDERIRDCVIDGYFFFWLRSSNEYARAADSLKNCLDEWRPWDSPVVCVKKNDSILAAIEVRKGQVVQARGFDNQSVENNAPLYRAFQKWMKRFTLEWLDDASDYAVADVLYEDGEDLPF